MVQDLNGFYRSQKKASTNLPFCKPSSIYSALSVDIVAKWYLQNRVRKLQRNDSMALFLSLKMILSEALDMCESKLKSWRFILSNGSAFFNKGISSV